MSTTSVTTTASPAQCRTNSSTVTVQGYGTAEAQPNELTISLGVQTQASSAAVALQRNSAAASALIATLESDGVAAKDLQTSGVSVQPVYTGPKQLITSYQVMNGVTVTLYDLSAAGKIIDDAAAAAGNAIVVNGINFSVANDDALLAEARVAAVHQAAAQAQQMASAAGMSLGVLCSLVDNTSPPSPNGNLSAEAPKAASPSTPIEAGQEQVTANVTAVYALDAAA
jgi:hypothetical protein